MALAVDLYEADLCPGCGQPRTYTMDRDARGHWHAPDPVRCFACTALTERRSADAKHKGHKPEGLYYRVAPDEAMTHAMEHPLVDPLPPMA